MLAKYKLHLLGRSYKNTTIGDLNLCLILCQIGNTFSIFASSTKTFFSNVASQRST